MLCSLEIFASTSLFSYSNRWKLHVNIPFWSGNKVNFFYKKFRQKFTKWKNLVSANVWGLDGQTVRLCPIKLLQKPHKFWRLELWQQKLWCKAVVKWQSQCLLPSHVKKGNVYQVHLINFSSSMLTLQNYGILR